MSASGMCTYRKRSALFCAVWCVPLKQLPSTEKKTQTGQGTGALESIGAGILQCVMYVLLIYRAENYVQL